MLIIFVRMMGIEPTRLTATDFKSVMYYQFHHIRIVEPRIIEIPTRTLQVFIAILGTCDPKLKDLYTGFEPVTISGELPELSPSIAVYQFRQYKSFCTL